MKAELGLRTLLTMLPSRSPLLVGVSERTVAGGKVLKDSRTETSAKEMAENQRKGFPSLLMVILLRWSMMVLIM